jgi:hypothetical protein
MLLRIVDADGGKVVGEQVAKQLRYQALLAIDNGGRAGRFRLLSNLRPDPVEVAQVRNDVLFRPAGGRGPDDDAAGKAVLLPEFPHDAAQPAALFARIDLSGNADVVDRRHEHQEAPRHRRVRGKAGALGTKRLLGYLDDDLLPFLEEFLDLWLSVPLAPARSI